VTIKCAAELQPGMLVSIAPGLLSMTPEVVLTPALAAVPLVNMVLVARDVFLGDVNSRLALVAVVTTSFYAVAAVGFAARIFGTDAILYGSHRSWSDLFERPSHPSPALAVGAALTCVALLFPGQFLVGGLLAFARDVPLAARIVAMAIASVLLFVGIPWISALVHRVPFTQGFRVTLPHWLFFVIAIVLGASLWPLAIWSLQWGTRIGLTTITDEQLKGLDDFVRQLNLIPPWLIVVTLGVVPGITEELFFRGVLFQSLRKNLSPLATIFATALLFALFHLISPGMMTTERFLPSFVMGVMLGWVAHRSGSVIPSILIHAVHNGLFLGLSPTYESAGVPTAESLLAVKLPTNLVIATTVGMVIGLGLTLLPLKPRK
jgi:ABC-2 type transport system permease protein/sodium transport system permease protein